MVSRNSIAMKKMDGIVNLIKLNSKIHALILAAGQSRRMGETNKLLLPYGSQSVICHVVEQVRASVMENITVVTGHEDAQIRAALKDGNLTFTHNENYHQGLSGSLKVGINSLPDNCDAVMVILGDMPRISTALLNKMIKAYSRTGPRPILIPTCENKRGNPLIWHQSYFEEFKTLSGDRGAKGLIRNYEKYVCEVDVNDDAIFRDMDTPESYQALMD